MAKKPENRRFESIPLPDTVVEALSPVPKQEFVSHSIKLDEKGRRDAENEGNPELTSDNHAFYIGKMIPDSTADKIRRVMNWGAPPERIYNKPFIKGALDYLFGQLKEGEKARVVVCRSLSEILNGPQDVEDALSTEKQIALIKKIAKKKFGKNDGQLEVQDLEQLDHHKELFKALRASVDPESKEADIEKALSEKVDEEGLVIVPETSSFQIARRLFAASQSNTKLEKAFHNARPARLKEENESEASKYYALIEVAIRLSDLLHGIHIQGGSDRQAIYNGIIIQLIKGEDGRYKDSKDLKPLFDILKGQRFETLALSSEKNYFHHKKVQTSARYRMLIYTALLASIALGGVSIGWLSKGKQAKEKEAEIQRKIIRERLKNVTFRVEGRWEIPKENNPEAFKSIFERAIEHLKLRYDLSEENCEHFKSFLKDYLLRDSRYLSIIDDNDFELIDYVDQFVREHGISFAEKGINIEIPYKNLQHLIPEFKRLLESEEGFVVDDSENPANYPGPGGGNNNDKKKFTFLGSFKSGSSYDNKFDFYYYQPGKNQSRYLVVRDTVKESSKKDIKVFSSERAKLGAWQFLYAMKRFKYMPIKGMADGVASIIRNPLDEYTKACESDEIPNTPSWKQIYNAVDFTDPETNERLSLMRKAGYPGKCIGHVQCLLAADKNSSHFSFKKAVKFAKRYYDTVWNKWHDYYRNDMKSDKSSK